MTRVLFICHGNICRSPMGEFILKDMVRRAGIYGDFEIRSAATSTEDTGWDMYNPAKDVLRKHDVPFERRAARQVSREDMKHFDCILIMDDRNEQSLKRMFGDEFESKIHKIMNLAGEDRDVSDPWYTRDFEKTYRDLVTGCEAFLRFCGVKYEPRN